MNWECRFVQWDERLKFSSLIFLARWITQRHLFGAMSVCMPWIKFWKCKGANSDSLSTRAQDYDGGRSVQVDVGHHKLHALNQSWAVSRYRCPNHWIELDEFVRESQQTTEYETQKYKSDHSVQVNVVNHQLHDCNLDCVALSTGTHTEIHSLCQPLAHCKSRNHFNTTI